MYKQVLLILLYCLSFPVYAQQYKANWEQVEKFGKIVDDFKNDLTIYPHFINDTDCFWYKIRTGEGLAFYLVDPVKKVHKELFDMPELLAQMGLLTNKAYTSISLEYIGLKFSKDGKKVSFSHDGYYFEYNLQTGKLRIVFNEVDKPYFDYVMPQTYYLNDADEILYRSERTGFGHFYLYDGKTGKQKRAVTKGEFVTGEIIRVDATKREMYLYAYGREKGVDPYYKMAYRVNLDKPGIELLTPENASHTIHISPSGNHDNRIYNTDWIEMHNGVEEKIVKNNSADSVCFKPLKIQTNVEIAKNCQGHLLLVTGMMDDNVHPAQTFRMARALMDAGINFDMIALPISTHSLMGSENEYFLFKMRNHFAKYLLGDFSGEDFMRFKKK